MCYTGYDLSEDEDDIDLVDILSDNNTFLKPMPCVIHTLQLCVRDFIKNCHVTVIDKVRNIVKKLRNSNTIEVVKKRFEVIPIIDVCTRWGSTYKMMERFLTIRSLCVEYAAVDKAFFLSVRDYEEVENVVNLLKLPYNVTIYLQKSDITAGQFYKEWCKLKVDLEKFGEMGQYFIDSMIQRQSKFLKNTLFLAAVYIDSRYRILLSDDEIKLAKAEITFQFKRKICDETSVVLVSSNLFYPCKIGF